MALFQTQITQTQKWIRFSLVAATNFNRGGMMGLFSRKKDTSSQEITLTGLKGQIATMKCLLMAGIREVSLKTDLTSSEVHIDQVNSYQYTDRADKSPTLTQGDFTVSGARAIMTYLDIRGKGASLVPKKARTLGLQNYWTDVCYQTLGPAAQAFIDKSATEEDENCINKVLMSLNKVLDENQYIVGQVSFADPNVAAYVYLLSSAGHDMTKYPNIGKWILRLEDKMSGPLMNEYLTTGMQLSSSQVA